MGPVNFLPVLRPTFIGSHIFGRKIVHKTSVEPKMSVQKNLGTNILWESFLGARAPLELAHVKKKKKK